MADFYVSPGDSVTFAKTVGESDIYLFAGITGDFSGQPRQRAVHGGLEIRPPHRAWRAADRLHVDLLDHDDRQVQAARPATRRRSRSATTASASSAPCSSATPSRVTYTDRGDRPGEAAVDRATSEVVNQNGELVAVAQHVLRWVKDKG